MRVLNDLCLVFYNISRRLLVRVWWIWKGGGLNNKTIHPHYTHCYSGLKIPNNTYQYTIPIELYLHIIRTAPPPKKNRLNQSYED